MPKAPAELTAIHPASNGAKEQIEYTQPYMATVTIQGVAPYLFHAWNNESVGEKSKASKGSVSKRTDDLEASVYRTPTGTLGIKGVALKRAIENMAKFKQDPRSPRKSAMDLYKAGVIAVNILADTGVKTWDYVDRQRVTIQHTSAITRSRPALREGWQAKFELLVTLPEYIAPMQLLARIEEAGRLNGIGDYRPTYGRFQVVKFDHKLA